MLFSVLIVSLMLTIAIGISSITFKQNLLSSLAKDSQIAFYQADAGVECGKYYDVKQYKLIKGSTVANVPVSIECGDSTLVLDPTASYDDYFVYREVNKQRVPCFSVIFDKTGINPLTLEPIYKIRGNGYNFCVVDLT